MNEDEYREWIDELVGQGVYGIEVGEDFKRQRALFEETFRGRIDDGDGELPGAVGCVGDGAVAAPSAPLLVFQAARDNPGRAIYFESLSADLG
jgi:hypothetical protein